MQTTLDPDLVEVCDTYRDGADYPDHDYHSYADHLSASKSKRSVITYLRYLAQWDQDSTVEDLKQFKQWAEKTAQDKFDDRNKQIRFMYFVRTAVKHYVGEFAEHLPDVGDGDNEIPMPRSNPCTIRLSQEQIQRVMEETNSDAMHLALGMAFYGSLRFFSLTHLTAEWLDFDADDHIQIRIPPEFAKGKKQGDPRPEFAFVPDWFEEPLKEHIKAVYGFEGPYRELYADLADEDRPGDFVTLFNFAGSPDMGERRTSRIRKERYRFNKRLRKAAKRSGVNNWQELGSHTPRRSMIFDLYEKVNDLNRTAEVVRHQDPATTKAYLKLDKEQRLNTFREAYG